MARLRYLIHLPVAGFILSASKAWLIPQRPRWSSRKMPPLYVATNPARQQHQATNNAAMNNNAVTNSSAAPRAALNPLLKAIKPSKTVEIFSLVKQMAVDGFSVTSLCVGEPDFLPPKEVLDATAESILRGETCYTALRGTIQLRKAIAADLRERKGVSYDPTTDIVVSSGAKQSVYQGVLATVGVGDKVLVPAPYWPSYPEMAVMVGAEPIILETSLETGFKMTPRELRRTLEEHPEIKLMILCNPSNPTGGVYHEGELMALVEVLNDFPRVRVLSDEIYERLVYNGDCPALASLPGMWERTMTVNGFSKSYAMTGMRLGYLAAPAYIAKAVATIQSQVSSCASSVSQAAGVAALTKVPEAAMERNLNIMKRKRDYVLDQLRAMPGIRVKVAPEGAFYVLPDVSAYCDGDDTNFCMRLLQAEQLAVVPGSSMGAPGTIRISYATSVQELETAMSKLKSFIQQCANAAAAAAPAAAAAAPAAAAAGPVIKDEM